MARKPTPKPRPHPDLPVLKVEKLYAAVSQLEAAIYLWFHDLSCLPILGLAAAAHDCFQAIGKKAGKPSYFQEWLESQSETLQKRAGYIRDYLKHGFMDIEENASYDPSLGEVYMISSVSCYEGMFGCKTALMTAYQIRFLMENPQAVRADARHMLPSGEYADYLIQIDRLSFFNEVFPEFVAFKGTLNNPRALGWPTIRDHLETPGVAKLASCVTTSFRPSCLN